MPQRPAGWRIEPPVSEPIATGAIRGDGGGAAARRTASDAVGVPRVSRGTEGGVFARTAHREFVHVGAADENGVGGAKLRDDRGVVGRDELFEHPGGAGGRFADGAEDILDRDGKAREEPERLAAGTAVVDALGGGEGAGPRRRGERR